MLLVQIWVKSAESKINVPQGAKRLAFFETTVIANDTTGGMSVVGLEYITEALGLLWC